ncbi:MAG TPA: plastocyanin/azurin family copper-binding protein [Acidimicrobiales bacterium]|jgi:plastocyanin|nr:plastocyanin/azurin family copper-binding protein [Acidimicrobiales bacterium]
MLSACGAALNEEAGGGAPPANEAMTVALRLITFQPENLTVPAGTAVTWANADGVDHTVTSGTVSQAAGSVTTSTDGRFDSGILAGGGRYSFTFSTPGTYAYFCALHPATMRGQIVVS